MAVHDPQHTGRIPKLAGQRWEDVSQYLEEFLKRLTNANDSTQDTLVAVTGAGTNLDSVLASRRPLPHRHEAPEVSGLESPLQARRALPHTHERKDIVGSTTEHVLVGQIFGW